MAAVFALMTAIAAVDALIYRDWNPGGPTFQLIDDPRDPENVKRWKEAEQFRRDNPNGLLIHHIVMSPPNEETDCRRYIEAGTNIEIAEADEAIE
jgi:hypothetical protein